MPRDPNAEKVLIQELQRTMAARDEPEPALAAQLDRLFMAHHRVVLGYCERLVRDPQRAAEIAQETMLIAYRKLPEFRGESGFGTWVVAIAGNLCRADRRKCRDLLTEDGVIDDRDPKLSALQELRREELIAVVRRAASALSQLEQDAILLRYEDGLSQDEITKALAIDRSSGGRGLLQRCRRKLRRELLVVLQQLGHGSSLFQPTL